MHRINPSRFALVVAATLLLPCSLGAQEPEPTSDQVEPRALRPTPRGACKVAGLWIGSSPPFVPELGDQTLIFSETITPLDNTCLRFSTVLTPVNPELTFSGLFPEATSASPSYGTLTRTAPNAYDVDMITYFAAPPADGLPIRGPVVYFWTYKGTVTCLDNRCVEKLQDGLLSLYSNTDDPDREFPPLGVMGISDQDMNDDGFPDEEETPIFQAPFPLSSQRFTQ